MEVALPTGVGACVPGAGERGGHTPSVVSSDLSVIGFVAGGLDLQCVPPQYVSQQERSPLSPQGT